MNVGTVRIFPEKEPAAKRVLKPLSWLADIDFVAHLIFENNVLVSVLGEQGSGKTTFAALLHADLSLQITPCSITASFQFDRGAFLQQLSILLGIESESSLSSFVAQTNAKKTHVILIIDRHRTLNYQSQTRASDGANV